MKLPESVLVMETARTDFADVAIPELEVSLGNERLREGSDVAMGNRLLDDVLSGAIPWCRYQ